MWRNIIVCTLLTLVVGFTLFSLHRRFTGKSSCCVGGCACKGDCGSSKAASHRDKGGTTRRGARQPVRGSFFSPLRIS